MKVNKNIFSNKEKAMFALRSLYASHGFSMYRMSKFEEFELYASNMDFLDSGQIITFTDTDGMLMALKPDVTLSIVKNNRHIGNRIIKLFYNENIYRVSPKTHYFKEIMQVGLECLGAVDDECISEVLLLAAESMNVLSDDAKLDVSNLDILTQLFQFLTVFLRQHVYPAGHDLSDLDIGRPQILKDPDNHLGRDPVIVILLSYDSDDLLESSVGIRLGFLRVLALFDQSRDKSRHKNSLLFILQVFLLAR